MVTGLVFCVIPLLQRGLPSIMKNVQDRFAGEKCSVFSLGIKRREFLSRRKAPRFMRQGGSTRIPQPPERKYRRQLHSGNVE
jgi:hypothetical protein